jgi:hypothetical protein
MQVNKHREARTTVILIAGAALSMVLGLIIDRTFFFVYTDDVRQRLGTIVQVTTQSAIPICLFVVALLRVPAPPLRRVVAILITIVASPLLLLTLSMPASQILPLASSVAPALLFAAWLTVRRPRRTAWLLVASPVLVAAVLSAGAVLLSTVTDVPVPLRDVQGEIENLVLGIAPMLTAIACGLISARITRSPAGTAPRLTTVLPRTPARRWTQRWLVVGALAGSAAVVSFGVLSSGVGFHPLQTLVHQSGGSASRASLTVADIGSWTAKTSTSPAPDAVERLGVQCLDSLSDSKGSSLGSADVATSNVEQRGTVTSLIASGGLQGTRAWCLAGDGGVVTAELIDAAASRLPSLPSGDLNLQTFGGSGSDGMATMSAYGQVGTDVRSLTVTLPGLPAAAASVQDGLWSLWWPAPDMTGLPDLGDVRLAWTTADGVSHEGTGMDVVWSAAK